MTTDEIKYEPLMLSNFRRVKYSSDTMTKIKNSSVSYHDAFFELKFIHSHMPDFPFDSVYINNPTDNEWNGIFAVYKKKNNDLSLHMVRRMLTKYFYLVSQSFKPELNHDANQSYYILVTFDHIKKQDLKDFVEIFDEVLTSCFNEGYVGNEELFKVIIESRN